MLNITCPVCGLEADETEFQAGGQAHIVRPASIAPDDVNDTAFRDYLYIRENSRGIANELWLCARGCGKWFHAARDTYSQEFKHFYKMSDRKPSRRIAKKPVKTSPGNRASAKPSPARRGKAARS